MRVNKDHCLACALVDTYQKWCVVNGRATSTDRLRMSATFFAHVIDEELDIQVAGFSVPNKMAELMRESEEHTKH